MSSMVMTMRIQYVHVLLFIMGALCLCNMMCGVGVDAATLGEKCSDEFEKVANCLSYATAKTETPSKECCSAVSDIRDSEPVCLCYIILQTHNGSKQVKSMGIQESRLLQLPSACKLVNASVSDCPLLLNIPKSSPEYAIFSNLSSSSNNTPTTTTPTTADDSSKGFRQGPKYQLVGPVTIAVAIFFYAFPAVFLAPFCT